jgi:ribonuclease P protein component
VRTTIRRGRRVRSGHIVVHYLAADHPPQVAVVAAKGVGGSVRRHLRQRQVRHVVAGLWQELPPGAYVVRTLPGTAGFDDLRSDLRRAVTRL